ncbi:MAG: hypothetical protein AAFV93_03110, partial [Chloroflexota bacterium]
MNFLESTAEDIHQYARSILYETDESNLHSFEDTANYIVGKIYDDFLNHRGERIFELVRIFRHVTEDDMPPEGQQDVPQADHWLALSGTIGREKAWNSRLQSAGHRLLPDDAFETPMLRAALHQLGFTPDSDGFIRSLNDLSNYFHVEQALGSPYIVAQEEFVKPYGIESVVGIGSMFASGAMDKGEDLAERIKFHEI